MAIGIDRGARGPGSLIISNKLHPIWPPRLHESIKMAITPSVFVIEIYLDSMTIGSAKGASDTRTPNNVQKTKTNMAAATS